MHLEVQFRIIGPDEMPYTGVGRMVDRALYEEQAGLPSEAQAVVPLTNVTWDGDEEAIMDALDAGWEPGTAWVYPHEVTQTVEVPTSDQPALFPEA